MAQEAPNLKALLMVNEISPGRYESEYGGFKRGVHDTAAFGGFAIGTGIKAAFSSLPPSPTYHLYSALGNFLGPTLAGVKVVCVVRSVRDTKTFATRMVEVKQQVKGTARTVMTILCDFHAAEPPSDPSLVYSAPPRGRYAHWSSALPVDELRERKLAAGEITQREADYHRTAMKMIFGFFEQRPCTEGVFGQNMSGTAKRLPTTQDGRAMPDKTTADWFRVKPGTDLRSPAEQGSGMAFLMDSFMSFAPLVFTGRFIEDAVSVGSLDFAFRVFESGERLDFNKWHLREVTTHVGAEGRTYSEARMWDESGKMVCCMTQQSIMRVKAEGPGKGKL